MGRFLRFLTSRRMPKVVAFGALLAANVASAQVGGIGKVVVGNQPGGATDIVARLLAPALEPVMGRTFVVENRVGASGNVAAEFVSRSVPDGSTILVMFNSHATVGALYPKLSFDPLKDLVSAGEISETPFLIVGRPDLGASDLKTVMDAARKAGKPLKVGTPGLGTPHHLLFEALKRSHQQDLIITHYKGSAPAQADVMGGHIDVVMSTPSLAVPALKAGKATLLGVTSEQRLADYPNAPTAREMGVLPLAGSGAWIGLMVPAKTPDAVIERINRALNTALQTPAVQERLKTIGMTAVGGSAQAMNTKLHKEAAQWTPLIREAKITATD